MRQHCAHIGEQCVTEGGFVSIPRLLEAFRAEIIVRPLLVEGMLARLSDAPEGGGLPRWAVAIDSESSEVSPDDVVTETAERPLPARVRNTIAHELAHSLAFRTSELGVRLSLRKADDLSEKVFVEEIERETEKLSPYLLIASSALKKFLQGCQEAVNAMELARFARMLVVSREVLISRLNTLPGPDGEDFRERKGLLDLGVGIGYWDTSGRAQLREWPTFSNFHRGLLPTFLARLVAGRHRETAIADVVDDLDFHLLGGDRYETVFETTVSASPIGGQQRIKVRLSAEQTNRRPGARFIYAVHGTLIREK